MWRSCGSHHLFRHPEHRHRVVVPMHGRDLAKGTLKKAARRRRCRTRVVRALAAAGGAPDHGSGLGLHRRETSAVRGRTITRCPLWRTKATRSSPPGACRPAPPTGYACPPSGRSR
ncbi:MAG: type II toxin-antitoxin system HicA family toxin [Gaiellaceae bacterium]